MNQSEKCSVYTVMSIPNCVYNPGGKQRNRLADFVLKSVQQWLDDSLKHMSAIHDTSDAYGQSKLWIVPYNVIKLL